MAGELYRDSADSQRDETIHANNWGGLNTVASPFNIPYGDSPELLNVDVTTGGTIQKRKGTLQLGEFSTVQAGVGFKGLTTTQGHNFILAKRELALELFTLENDTLVSLVTKNNVFSSRARRSRPTFTNIDDRGENKVLVLTGTNAPVQVTFAEQAVTLAAGTTCQVVRDARFEFGTTASVIAYIRDPVTNVPVRVPVTFTAWDAGTTALNVCIDPEGVGTYPEDRTMEVVYVSWQWWAEAYVYQGDRFYNYGSRFGVSSADRHVPIPERLRDSLIPSRYAGVTTPKMTISSSLASAAPGYYTFNTNPTTNLQWTFTDGQSAFTNTTTHMQETVDGTTHATVGDISLAGLPTSAQNATALHMHRSRELKFLGNSLWQSQNVLATRGYSDGITYGTTMNRTNGSTPAAGLFAWTARLSNGTLASSGATFVKHVDFSVGGTYLGIPRTEYVRFVHTVTAFIGSGVVAGLSRYRDGNSIPAYGLGEYADYQRGYFPTVAAIHQNRLVFGGVPNDSLRIIFSAIADTQIPGEFYNHFQIDAFTDNLGALDYYAISTSDDYVNGLVSYQGSLFVFTRKTAQRFKPLEDGTFLPQLVARLGLINPTAHTLANERLVFSSDEGVYELVPTEGFSDAYTTSELSTKVSNIFRNSEYTASILGYDPLARQLFVSMDTYALVMNIETGAWSKFELYSSAPITYLGNFLDSADQYNFLIVTNFLAKTRFLKTNFDYYIDFATIPITPTYSKVSHIFTSANDVREYAHIVPTSGLDDVEDIEVFLDGGRQPFKENYWKRGNRIYFKFVPYPGATIEVREYHPGVGLDSSAYLNPGNTLYYGYAYLATYSTPTFTSGSLAKYKRLVYFDATFDNSVKNGVFTHLEVLPGQENAQWVGTNKIPLNVNLALLFNTERGGDISTDIYGFYDLVWDYSLFDISGNIYDENDFVRIRTPIQGLGYSMKAKLFNWGQEAWSLAAFQLDGKVKGKRAPVL